MSHGRSGANESLRLPLSGIPRDRTLFDVALGVLDVPESLRKLQGCPWKVVPSREVVDPFFCGICLDAPRSLDLSSCLAMPYRMSVVLIIRRADVRGLYGYPRDYLQNGFWLNSCLFDYSYLNGSSLRDSSS